MSTPYAYPKRYCNVCGADFDARYPDEHECFPEAEDDDDDRV